MKISHSYKLFAATVAILLIVLGLVVFKALHIQADIIHSEQHRLRSFLLAVELFQSSEDLTRMARSYVATGKPVYKKHYFAILDIRNGHQPRPAHYNVTYWHLAGIGNGPPVAPGERIALQDLMRREGFTEQELSLLQNSQANSDHLVIMEKQAFAALHGLYDDGHGNFTVRRAPDHHYASDLLFSEQYVAEKARIMAPIEQFMAMLDQRTQAELISFQAQLRQQIILALFLVFITLFIVLTKTFHTFQHILLPLKRLLGKVTEISSGNYAARCPVGPANEIGELCTKFNGMADSLQADILMRREAEEELKISFATLQKASEEIKTLKGIVPICANCKKIRGDKGYWEQVESYVASHTEAVFSHGICPDCVLEIFPEYSESENPG